MDDKPANGRLYARIANDLAQRIARGEFGIGQRLPPERILSQDYSVSRPTIREALIALEVDGLVEVRVNNGVYVQAVAPVADAPAAPDFGPFEILGARLAVEGEACALAAQRATPEALRDIREALDQMAAPRDDIVAAEEADRQLHLAIARATENSALYAIVEMLWGWRERSPQYRLLTDKARAAGVGPSLPHHVAIVDAIAAGDAARARQAMHDHLATVVDALLAATEEHEMEQVRARVDAERDRWRAYGGDGAGVRAAPRRSRRA